MVKSQITKGIKETQKVATTLASEILKLKPGKTAVVLGLLGELGAGKTTFLQGFAKGLGVKEKVLSPTFILMRKFQILKKVPQNRRSSVLWYNYFYHFDCYRLNNVKEILDLGFENIISNPKNIVAIEWPEKISKVLPKDKTSIKFEHIEKNKRRITIDNF